MNPYMDFELDLITDRNERMRREVRSLRLRERLRKNRDHSGSSSTGSFRVLLALVTAALATGVLALVLGAEPAQAAFPGFNGAIAFTSIQNGNADIWRMGADGFNPTKLTESAHDDDHPAWSAEGTRIAFVSKRPDAWSSTSSDPEIWRMDASGNDETQLTDNVAVDLEPAWFPSDTKLAFTSNRYDVENSTDFDIYVMTLDENAVPVGQPQQITTNTALDSQPAVSPDGKRIAFLSERDGDYDIYVMKATPESSANKPIKLTNNNVPDKNPDWSPSGKKIVFESNRDGSDPEILMMNADGTSQKQLTKNEWNDTDPVFSPSGTRIAFESTRTSYQDIYRMRTDGTYQVNLIERLIEDRSVSWQPAP